jgi:hypothetical protein
MSWLLVIWSRQLSCCISLVRLIREVHGQSPFNFELKTNLILTFETRNVAILSSL